MERLFVSWFVLMMLAANASAQSTTQQTRDCEAIKAQATRLVSRLNDWPALARYRESNTKIAPPSEGENRVVFMGDSITDFWTKRESGGFFPDKPYLNRGISGQTTQQMLVRFRPDVIALKPKVVVILAGTNDLAVNHDIGMSESSALQVIKDNLTSMVELARLHGLRVVLASLLPVNDYNKAQQGTSLIQSVRRSPTQIKALNNWMRTYAAENNLTYLDYYSAMVDEKGFLKVELSNDGLHPTVKGYEVMAPLVERAIATSLKKKM